MYARVRPGWGEAIFGSVTIALSSVYIESAMLTRWWFAEFYGFAEFRKIKINGIAKIRQIAKARRANCLREQTSVVEKPNANSVMFSGMGSGWYLGSSIILRDGSSVIPILLLHLAKSPSGNCPERGRLCEADFAQELG